MLKATPLHRWIAVSPLRNATILFVCSTAIFGVLIAMSFYIAIAHNFTSYLDAVLVLFSFPIFLSFLLLFERIWVALFVGHAKRGLQPLSIVLFGDRF